MAYTTCSAPTLAPNHHRHHGVASTKSLTPRLLLCISWRRVACILICFYVAFILLVFRSIQTLHQIDLHDYNNHNNNSKASPFSTLQIDLETILEQFTGRVVVAPASSASSLAATTPKLRQGHATSVSSSSVVVAAAVAAINAFKDPRVDDWYKDQILRMENDVANIGAGDKNVGMIQSCRRVQTGDDPHVHYYSIDPLAACHKTSSSTTKESKKFVYFNPHARPRTLCGHTLAANDGTLELDDDEPCFEPSRLFPVIPSLETANEMPPITVRFNDKGQRSAVQPFDGDCDIPCHHGGYMHILSTRTVDGTPYQFTWSMEAEQYYPQLHIRDAAYKDNIFYSTTSFHSEVPLPYFSYAEYKIQNPALDYNHAEKAAVFLARNCGSVSQREALVKALQESKHFRIDSLSQCLHNAEPPNGVDLGDKVNVMQHYLFYLAFENQRVNDYITEKLWGPYEAGTVPVYFGAPNIKQLAPNHSYIDVDDFPTPDDLAVYLNKVANNQTLYESYHSWRHEPLPPHFTAKFNISNTHSTCRTCRWAFARMYGLGWSHENQSISRTLRSTSRNVCLDSNSISKGGGMITRPFQEVWLDAETNHQVMADANLDFASKTMPSCQRANSKTRTIHLDDGRLQRTVWEQDGVVDIVLEWTGTASTNTVDQQQQNRKLKTNLQPHRKLRLRIDTPIEIPAQLNHIREGQVRFQNHHSRFTLLTWPTRVSNITHVAATNGSALVLDLHQISWHVTFPLRLRMIVEDIDLFHKGADKLENYFGQVMIDDFFQPVEAFFYRDETRQS